MDRGGDHHSRNGRRAFANKNCSHEEELDQLFQMPGVCPGLPTESMNDFHSHSFKHIFDQLDATNFNQWQNLAFNPHKLITNYLNTDFPTIPQFAPTEG